MAITHAGLIDVLNRLEYTTNADGVCFGLSNMAMQAFFAKDMDSFVDRLKKIAKLKDKDIEILKSGRHSTLIQLDNEQSIMALDIKAFLDGVMLYQSTKDFQPILGQHAQDDRAAKDLITPISLDNDKQRPVFTKIISGAFQEEDLKTWVRLLTSHLQVRTSVLLRSTEHAINISFDPDTKIWTLTDANNLPPKQLDFSKEPTGGVDKKFAQYIDGMLGDGATIFSASFYAQRCDKQMLLNNLEATEAESSGAKLIKKITNDSKSKTSSSITLLHVAAAHNNLDVAKGLLAAKTINVNDTDINNVTPLLLAVQNGHLEMVKALLEADNIDVNQLDINGVTPLLMAAILGYLDVVKALLTAKKINVNQIDNHGVAPLLIAAQEGHLEMVNALLADKNININQAEKNTGVAPLLIAAQEGHLEVVGTLLRTTNIDVNQAENTGATPLLIAAQEGRLEVVQALLATKNIDINKANYKGATPLFMAAQIGDAGIIVALVNAGANIDLAFKTNKDWLASFNQKNDKEVVARMALFLSTQKDSVPSISPKDIALIMGHTTIYGLLKKKEAQESPHGKKTSQIKSGAIFFDKKDSESSSCVGKSSALNSRPKP